jgi:hypothetical protein
MQDAVGVDYVNPGVNWLHPIFHPKHKSILMVSFLASPDASVKRQSPRETLRWFKLITDAHPYAKNAVVLPLWARANLKGLDYPY